MSVTSISVDLLTNIRHLNVPESADSRRQNTTDLAWDLYMESTACKRLCERLFSRIVKSSSSCTPRNDRRCFFESCQGIIGSVAATDDYNECPSICDSMSNGMHYLYLPVPPTMKEVRNICWTFGFPKKARNHLRTTAVTYSNEEFSNCEELCEYLFSGIIENSRCTHPQSELCLLDTCLSIIRSEVSTYQEARYMTTMEIIRFCAKGVSPKKTTKPPRTTAVTYPYEAFSNCKKLCVYVFPRTLKPYKYFCPDGGKKYNTCVLSSCKEVVKRTLMDGGQDAKNACPNLCSSMAIAMSNRNMDRKQFGQEQLRKFCLKIVPPLRTTKPPRTTAVTYPYEEFSNCRKLCVYVFPRTLKPYKYFCPDGGKKYNTCVLSSCKEVVKRTLMDDGQDAKNACPNLCSSMAIAMSNRNMDRKQFGKEQLRKFCLKIVPPLRTTKPPRTTAVTYPYEEFSNCKKLCLYVFPRTLKPYKYFCQHGGKKYNTCVLSSCKEVVKRTLTDDGQDAKHACPNLCSHMAIAMSNRNMDRKQFGKEQIRKFCLKIVPPVMTTKPPRTTAVTYPYEEFSNCKKLCLYVFPRTLKPYKYFCQDGGKKYNTCVLSSCKEVVKRTLMNGGQDAKHACPNLCSHMALAMRNRNMDRKQFGKEQIHKFCLKIVPPVRTTKPPRTTAVTGTDIPTTTAEMSFSTTEMHATTTEIPTTTTETPSTTTEISSSTTEMHSTTTEIPTTTTETPSTTAEISSSTTEMHSTTTEIPTTTTETPSTTAEISSSTTEMHSTTTEIPTTTTETPSTTAEISSSTTEMHSTTTEIPTTTTETPSTTAEISSSTTEMHSTTTEIPTTTTETPSTTAKISSSTTEMHSTTTEIPTTTTETPSTTAEISSSTTEMHATTTEVPITTTEMSSFTTEMPL
ncbi:hypothetical protein RB195_017477 [Necator americanus]|uniref:Uncharacterized protein n=1 Tax=Necator americanus TaxID=51031 RepID=A0ABR1C8K6_NECAM